MINFKNRAEAVPSAILLCAILTLAATLAYMILVPLPNAAGVVQGRERSRRQLVTQIAQVRERAKEAHAGSDARLWNGDHDTVMAAILARLTKVAAHNNLTLAAFRPQKPQQVSGMTELPITLQVSGPYPTVLAFLRSVDAPANRLALRSLQIASSDAATNTVAATVGLSAYYRDSSAAAAAGGPAPRAKTALSAADSATPAAASGGSRG